MSCDVFSQLWSAHRSFGSLGVTLPGFWQSGSSGCQAPPPGPEIWGATARKTFATSPMPIPTASTQPPLLI
ncbi:hypothetical protein N658DRAFT_6316 [Parathielavia hyrcaniae]|uniref:Uncharacterized protein n=1 Tax=Parathielavia hyrcaniae TaxID=113614 RepID=A0AAN6Q9E9_9PEZI|nr:hypothetical protein N658DRAFT_6316 [Parathielavia hyrcaniae]